MGSNLAPGRGVCVFFPGHRVHLAAAAVVVLEPAHPVGAGVRLLRLAFGEFRIARPEFAYVLERGRRVAMVAPQLRGFARHIVVDRNHHFAACYLSLVRLRPLVRPAAASVSKYGVPQAARRPGRVLENLQHCGRDVRGGAHSQSDSGARHISLGNRFHAIV